jgi:multidrug efflux pump
MQLSEICIKRPVLAWVMTFVLILLGIVALFRLPLQQYPNFSRSFVTVETSLPGAGPEVVEAQISRVVEEALSGIEGIEAITSISSSEDSKVTVEFRSDRLISDCINDIRDRLSKNRDKLPHEATEPTLTKSRAEEAPIITLALTSDSWDSSKLADFAKRELVKDLESVSGVARVDVLGAGEYTMRIFLDPIRLAAYGITVSEVLHAIKKQNIEKPAGKLISKSREYAVTTVASLEKPEEFERLVVASRKNFLVRLMDIGRAEITADDKRTKTRFNGKQGVSIDIVKQSNSNPVGVAREVKKLVEESKRTLPDGVFIHTGSDSTVFIEKSIKEVYHTIFEATLLVILVVFLFLRSARASFIPLVTIPVSLIGTFFLMYLLNFSINMLTLMAMVLAIGLVVDDAIVVLENVYRYIEEGMKPFPAAVKGIREISFAVIAMTLTLVAVYIPITLAKGMTGKLLTEFAITLAGAVVISGFAALTLSPMMCARMLGESKVKKDWWYKFKEIIPTEKILHSAEISYEKCLNWVVKKRLLVVFLSMVFAFCGYVMHKNLPSMLLPKEDRGSIRIEGQAPQTATLAYTEKYVDQLDKVFENIPEIERRVIQINNPTLKGSIQLKEDRARTTDEVAEYIKKNTANITGVEAKIDTGSSSGDTGTNRVEFVLRGNKTYSELKSIVISVVQDLYASGKVQAVHTEIRGDTADFTVTVIRDKLSALNIEPDAIAETIDTLIRGRRANFFKRDNKMYEVRVEVENSARQSPEDITNLFVKAGDKEGTLVPLSELVSVNARSSPIEIHRHNRMRAIGVTVFMKPDSSLGEGVELAKAVTKDLEKNSDYKMQFVDETKRFLTEGRTIELVFFLALCFIYLVMAAQFESWRDPFTIILSVPLSLAGAVFTLGIIDKGSINIYSNIGLITLIGLITKHGILMVDFANKLRLEDAKETINSAIIKSCKLRLRPILMTTFAMVLGAVPLALSSGAGSENRRQLGWVIVGGMSIGTIFTLFVVPAFYTYLTKKNIKTLKYSSEK